MPHTSSIISRANICCTICGKSQAFIITTATGVNIKVLCAEYVKMYWIKDGRLLPNPLGRIGTEHDERLYNTYIRVLFRNIRLRMSVSFGIRRGFFLHSPNHDFGSVVFSLTVEYLFAPRFFARTVENNKVSFTYVTGFVHIFVSLF